MGNLVLRNIITIVIFSLLFATNIVSSNTISEDLNFNITSFDKILQLEEGFVVTSTKWSPDGK